MKIYRNRYQFVLISAILILSLNHCASYNYAEISKNLKETYPGQPEGYIKTEALPDSKLLLPPPPQPGSAAFENDMEISNAYLIADDSLRWKQAQIDAILEFPYSIDAFTGILEKKVSVETTPYLYLLLQRVIADASASTNSAKTYYKRQRPFVVNNQPSCDPAAESFLRTNGSYPSGHSAIGWTWALILAELYPGQANTILQRGIDYGESRIICNVHWYSDVVGGRLIGSATFSVLHGNREFQHDLRKAKKEIRRNEADNSK